MKIHVPMLYKSVPSVVETDWGKFEVPAGPYFEELLAGFPGELPLVAFTIEVIGHDCTYGCYHWSAGNALLRYLTGLPIKAIVSRQSALDGMTRVPESPGPNYVDSPILTVLDYLLAHDQELVRKVGYGESVAGSADDLLGQLCLPNRQAIRNGLVDLEELGFGPQRPAPRTLRQ